MSANPFQSLVQNRLIACLLVVIVHNVVYLFYRLELCNFSGYKIHPGHGKRFVRIDGKVRLKSRPLIDYLIQVFNFLNGKCTRSHFMKRNPRETRWTILYRRKHKKGTQEEVSKRRTRRTVKYSRPIQGASLQEILMKRNQKPEVRKAQREQVLRAAKAKENERKEKQRAQKVKDSLAIDGVF